MSIRYAYPRIEIDWLACIGLVRIRPDGSTHWPIHFAPGWVWREWRYLRAWVITNGWFYVFRNSPGIVKWQEGRMLPRRWGFGIAGLIEFGDRG